MQADTLAGLLRELDMAPAVIIGRIGRLARVDAHRRTASATWPRGSRCGGSAAACTGS